MPVPQDIFVRSAETRNLQALAQWSAINKTVFDHLNKAIQIQPLEPSYHFHRSIAFLHQGDFLGAISDLETATKVSSNSPFVKRFKAQVQVHYGLKCLDEANYSVAYRLFHSSLDSYPDTTFLKTVIASTCIQLNRYSDGLTLLNQILQPQLQAKKSVPLESLVLRSYIYAHLQQYQASCKDLQLAFEQNPSGTDEMKFMSRYLSTAADRLRYLAFAHVDRQQFQQAFNAIELALDIRPGSRDLIKDRALIYQHLKQFDLGIRDLMSLEYHDSQSRNALAGIYLAYATEEFSNKDYHKAFELVCQSLKWHPTPKAYRVRGLCFIILNQPPAAIRDLEQYLATEPGDWEIRSKCAQMHCRVGEGLAGREQLSKAVNEFTLALDLDSELESGWYGRAKVYMRMQELNKARNDLVKALKINPENAIAQRLLDQINLSGGVEKKRPIQGVIGISLQ